jgi:2-C-methyl-D-erythritol 2,4-cyclodiphosphate synthase
MGFDIHRLTEGRPLWLGGVQIPHGKGLLGHSDADIVLHALCDALLGAAGAGDIGSYFPDTDPKWKGASSKIFVEKAMELVRKNGWALSNADLTVIAEEPKLVPHRETIVRSIAKILGVPESVINFKARTMEKLGPIGAGEAMSAYAVVLLESK